MILPFRKNRRHLLLAKYPIWHILPLISEGYCLRSLITENHISVEVNLGSKHLRHLKQYPNCVGCGRDSNICLLLQNKSGKRGPVIAQPTEFYRPYLNVYHMDDDSNLYLMTIDHIKPRSLGGTDAQVNSQTMCVNCNARKGNTYQTMDL